MPRWKRRYTKSLLFGSRVGFEVVELVRRVARPDDDVGAALGRRGELAHRTYRDERGAPGLEWAAAELQLDVGEIALRVIQRYRHRHRAGHGTHGVSRGLRRVVADVEARRAGRHSLRWRARCVRGGHAHEHAQLPAHGRGVAGRVAGRGNAGRATRRARGCALRVARRCRTGAARARGLGSPGPCLGAAGTGDERQRQKRWPPRRRSSQRTRHDNRLSIEPDGAGH